MAINLKNYTTEVPAARSIEKIENILVEFGATNIMKEYGPGGKCEALSFIVAVEGMKLPFRLPVKVENAYVWLKNKKPQTSDKTLWAQAERMVWKQQYEWVFLQLSMIELDQAEKLELLLPYLYDVQKQETYYQKLKQGGFKMLTNG